MTSPLESSALKIRSENGAAWVSRPGAPMEQLSVPAVDMVSLSSPGKNPPLEKTNMPVMAQPGSIPGAAGVDGHDFSTMYGSLAFSYLPMAASVPGEMLHHVMSAAVEGKGEEALPGAGSGKIKELWAAWHANPALVSQGIDRLCSGDSSHGFTWEELHTLEIAMDTYGYRPGEKAVAWLFKGLDTMAGEPSRASQFELEQALNILVAIKEQDPSLIGRQQLPGSEKALIPATRSLFNRLMDAPGLDYRPDRHWQQGWTTSLLKFCFPDKELQSELISSLRDSIARRGSVNQLNEAECKALETLAVLPLESPEKDMFLDLLKGDILAGQGREKRAWIIDKARSRELSRGLAAIGSVSAGTRLGEVLRLLEISQIDTSMMNREYWSERLIPAAFPPGDPAVRQATAEGLWDGFKEAYTKAGSIGNLGRHDTAVLQVIESLSADENGSLSRDLLELLVTELRTDGTPKDGAPYYVCQRLRKRRISENIKTLATFAVEGEKRQGVIDETRDLLAQIHWKGDELARLFEETVKASDFVTETSRALETEKRIDPVELVEAEHDTWLVVDGIRLKINSSRCDP